MVGNRTIPLGAFELHNVIRKGGMGEVWRGIHKGQGVAVAIKVMTGRRARHPKYIEAFRNEVESVARLDHPGVVMIFDHGAITPEAAKLTGNRLVAGSPYLVMELATQGALDRVRRRPSWGELRQLCLSLLDALAHAHARGVVHRDLKPGNILVAGPQDTRPGMKLTDFGLAHALDQQREGTRESRAGTPRYMAPELFEGRFRDYGPWTDLYALGCMVYELVTREPMFPGTTAEELRRQHHYDVPPVIGQDPALPRGFDSWLQRLAQKKPEARFQRAADAAWAFLGLGDPEGWVPEGPPSVPSEIEINPQAATEMLSSFAGASAMTLMLPDPSMVAQTLLYPQDGVRNAETFILPASGIEGAPTYMLPRSHAIADVTTHFLSATRPSPRAVGTTRPPRPPNTVTGEFPPPMDMTRPPVPMSFSRATSPTPPISLIGAGQSLFGMRTVRLVNRDEERAAIWKALLEVQSTNNARLVLLTGETGVGKSRLVQWTSQRADEVGAAHVLKAEHGPMSGPAHGLPHMFARHMRCVGLSRPELRRRLRAQLRGRWGVDKDYEWDALTQLIAAPAKVGVTARAKVVRFSGPGERYAVYRRYLDRLGTERPVVVWLDDVHYGADALWFAQYVLRAQEVTPSPVLFLATARSDLLDERTMEAHVIAQILERKEASTVKVGPLGPVPHSELVQRLLGLESDLAALVERRTAGNPLFATELVGSWVEQGLLTVSAKGFVLREGAEARTPSSVAEIWDTRIANLLGDSPDIDGGDAAMEIAAVLGLRVDATEWESACEEAGVPLSVDVFYLLVTSGLAVPEEGAWRFSHDFIRDNLLNRARQGGRWSEHNAACARMLAARYPSTARGVAERVGEHLMQAGRHGEALEPLFRGAVALLDESEYRRALELIRGYDQCLEELEAGEEDARWGRGRLVRARVLRLTGQFDESFDLAEEAVSAGWKYGWEETLPDLMTELGGVAIDRGNLELASSLLGQALTAHREAGSVHGVARCLGSLGKVAEGSGDLGLATTLLRRSLLQFERVGDRTGVADCMYRLWKVIRHRGDLKLAADLLGQSLHYHRKQGNELGVATCTAGLGHMALSRRALAEATDRFQEAMALFGDLDAQHGIAECLVGLAVVARLQGDEGVALNWCQRALMLQHKSGTGAALVTQLEIARIRLASGDHEDAQRELLAVAEEAAKHGQRTLLVQAHAALLFGSALASDWEAWDVHLAELQRLAEATGLVEAGLADAAQAAATVAIEAKQSDRARDALEIALGQWWELRDRERAARARALLDALP
jgi:eukaryotic-like serine/threonine-protein kinase